MLQHAWSPGIAIKGMPNPWMDVRIFKGIISVVDGRNSKRIRWHQLRQRAYVLDQIVNKVLESCHAAELGCISVEPHQRGLVPPPP